MAYPIRERLESEYCRARLALVARTSIQETVSKIHHPGAQIIIIRHGRDRELAQRLFGQDRQCAVACVAGSPVGRRLLAAAKLDAGRGPLIFGELPNASFAAQVMNDLILPLAAARLG